jgi:tetraacyldisaccharide 4'-kinase
MRPPGFWQRPGSLPSLLLAPVGGVVASAAARRAARPGWRAPVPVICCGNVTVGGAGKTTVALELARRLLARGVAAHFLTRGYGGRAAGVVRVDPARPDPARTGDEPLLLAEVAPCWVSADRAAGARAAVAAGAGALVMDDGLQNPTLAKTMSLLVVDGGTGFGNGRVLPAGPLREPVAAGAARCRAAVLIGEDRAGAAAALPAGFLVLRARLVPRGRLDGLRVLAFAGIAHPAKFFASAEEAGAAVVERVGFADHHPYARGEIERLLARAAALDAEPLTTAKDAVRLPPDLRARVRVLGVSLAWENDAAIDALLAEALG